MTVLPMLQVLLPPRNMMHKLKSELENPFEVRSTPVAFFPSNLMFPRPISFTNDLLPLLISSLPLSSVYPPSSLPCLSSVPPPALPLCSISPFLLSPSLVYSSLSLLLLPSIFHAPSSLLLSPYASFLFQIVSNSSPSHCGSLSLCPRSWIRFRSVWSGSSTRHVRRERLKKNRRSRGVRETS